MPPAPKPNLVVVLGPTASGKTRLAVALANALGTGVISADSRQVYTGLDIGTGKDREEYGDTPVHLLDIADPNTECNVFTYQRDCNHILTEYRARNEIPVLAGGSGLYIEAVLGGYRFGKDALPEQIQSQSQEKTHEPIQEIPQEKIEPNSEIIPLIFGVQWPRPVLRARITARLKQRLNDGMIDEVKGLLEQGVSYERLEALGLEYRWVALYLRDEMRYNDFFQRLNSAIHQFAKRQDTWFRKMERAGYRIEWLKGGEDMVDKALARLREIEK